MSRPLATSRVRSPRSARPGWRDPLCGLLFAAMLCGVVFSGGCETMKRIGHEFKPHRLQRWSRTPGPSNTGTFSVVDAEAEAAVLERGASETTREDPAKESAD